MIRLISILYLLILIACNGSADNPDNEASPVKPPVRYGMVTGIEPGKIGYYIELHAKPWPQVMATLNACNIHNYSIYIQKIKEQHYLFSYFEYTGNDFDADMKKMAADTVTQRWWRETDPCQLPLPEAMEKHTVWTKMEEVFHAD